MQMRSGNKQLIRDINKSLIINEIRLNSPVSRTKIGKRLNLGLSTVTYIVDELIKQKVVLENGEADSTGGRRPVNLEFNYDYGYTIGIKIEENCIIAALTNLSARVLIRKKVKYKKNIDSSKVIELIISQIEDLKGEISEEKNILGIGIAVSGLVDKENGCVIYSGLLNWRNVDIKNGLEKHFNIPVFLDNDVNAYTLAELWQGYGRKVKDFIVISYGAGIGSGIVLNSRLYKGAFGGAGELGHTIVQVEGRLCECGQKGCLEAYASEKFLIDYIKENISTYKDTKIRTIDSLSIENISRYAEKGDRLAVDSLKISAKYLGYGILSIVNLLNPSTIILAGEGLRGMNIVLPVVKNIVKNNFFKSHNQKLEVLVSELGDEAWEKGAALLVISELFEMPLYRENKNEFSSLK